ncbi:MAG TPA: MFS transporter [Ktedonobacterales bacterium]|nr:MFS transporter [Ktedonobacterales bacterium]
MNTQTDRATPSEHDASLDPAASIGLATPEAPTAPPEGDTNPLASAPDVEASGGETAPAAEKHGFLSPLRIANFRRLFSGQLVSRLGDNFYAVALPWLVLRAVTSAQAPLALSFVLGSYAVAIGVFTLAGGVFADRYGPRPLMLVTDSWRLVIVCVLGVLTLTTTPPLWVIAALAAGLGAGTGLFYPASVAMVPHLVPADDLQAANSFDQLGLQTSNLLGPSAAGFILVATRLAFGFVIDAASFAVSLVTLAAIRMPARAREATGDSEPSKKKGDGSLREAARFLRGAPFIVLVVSVSLVLNFAVNGLVDVALPLLLKQQVGVSAGPRDFGIIIGGFGLGSVVGAVMAGMASKLRRKALVSVATLLPAAALIGLVPLFHNPYAIAGLFVLMGVCLGLCNVLIITVVQGAIPLEMMGRVMSVMLLGSFVGTPLSLFAYGAAAALIHNIGLLFVIGAALFAGAAVVALANKMTWAME